MAEQEAASSKKAGAFIAIALCCGLAVGYLAGCGTTKQELTQSAASKTLEGQHAELASAVVGGDKDDNNCLTGAGYTWCPSVEKCLQPWADSCPGGVPFCQHVCKLSPEGVAGVACNCKKGVAWDYKPVACLTLPTSATPAGEDVLGFGVKDGKCVEVKGSKMSMAILTNPRLASSEDMCEAECLTDCQLAATKVDKQLETIPLLGVPRPQCDEQGDYSPAQCYGSTGMCWCVEAKTGNVLEGTEWRAGESPKDCDGAQPGMASLANGKRVFRPFQFAR